MVRQVLMYEVVGFIAGERLQTLRAPSTKTVPNTFLIFCRKLPLLPTMFPNFFHNFQRSTSWSDRLYAAERLQTLRAPSTETVPNTFLIFCRKLPLLPTMFPNFFHNFQRSTSWSGRS